MTLAETVAAGRAADGAPPEGPLDVPAGPRCPHGRPLPSLDTAHGRYGRRNWDHVDRRDAADREPGEDLCPTCAVPFAELRGALERIRLMTGDARVRRIAERALGHT